MLRARVPLFLLVCFAALVVAAAPAPQVRFDPAAIPPDVPAQVLIGDDFTFRVRFSNLPAAAIGYGPFIDVVLDAGGANIAKPSCPCDGITFVQANMIGVNGGPVPLVSHQSQAPCAATPSTVSLSHPFSGVLPVAAPAGSQLVTLELPFGSFDATQPEIVVEVTAHVSNLADANHPLTISARGGFRYGADALNNAPPDWPVVSDLVPGNPPADQQIFSTSWFAQAQTTPTLFTLDKKYLGPEDETATGPNFLRRYQITLDVATNQTIQNLKITDHLPNNMAFHALVSAPACFTVTSPVPDAAHNPPNNDLVLQCSSITGVAGPDAVIIFEFFIPQLDGNGQPILSPTSCAPVSSVNDIAAEGDWTPTDACDTSPVHIVSDVTPTDHTLADKCLAIQKTVVNLNGPAPAHPIPGDTLEYTLNFQLSDFKTAGKLRIRDVLSDGQTIVAGSFTLTVTDQCGTIPSSTIPASAITQNTLACTAAAPPPRTEIIIDVSAAMTSLANTAVVRHVGGVLTGGHALTPTTTVPATGTIKFRTTISDAYQCAVPPPHDVFVDKDDPLSNTVTITAEILANGGSCATVPANAGFTAQDDSKVEFRVATDFLSKSIFAVTRGSLQICGPNTAACPAQPQVIPGDVVTFRLTKTIPSSDAENITIQDWLPLPIFLVAGTTFSNTICGIPSVGASCLGPANTLNVAPTYLGNGPTNSFTFTYPTTFNDPFNQPHTIDLLFTRAVTNDPFADGLYITNEAQECESDSFGTTFCQSAIVQVQVREPSLKITKGIVAASNPNAVFSPSPAGPVSFTAPGASCPRFTGAITSNGLASTPIQSDVSGVDANDCVTFAIVVENTGGSAAYDINLRETFPVNPDDTLACYVTDSPSLCVTDGAGTQLPFTTSPGRGSFVITLQNPLPPSNATGSNIAILTFDSCIFADITPGCCDNTARVESYASTPGGPNFVDGGFGGPFSDAARVCVVPKATKSILATSESHTTGTQVAVGEIVRYRLEVVVPESTSPNTYQLQDVLPAGLSYLGNLTVSPTNFIPVVTSNASCNGGTVTFTFNNVINANNTNAQELITLDFNALVCNVASNQNSTLLNNSFTVLVNGQPLAGSNSVQVSVVEPSLTIAKSGTVPTVTAGATATYTITLTNNGPTTAFDVRLMDILPACLTGLTSVQSSVPATNASTATTLDLTVASIPVNGVVTVQYSATVSCTDCNRLTNTARVTWTSLPGPLGSTSNPTGSPTPGASGLATGERNGSGGINDYAALASATICCLLVTNDVISCNPTGYTYTATMTNSLNFTSSGILFSPTSPANVTISPASINTPLAPGASTTVTLTLSGAGAVPGANVCFSAALFAAAVFCRVDHCVTLPPCCVAPPTGMVAWYQLDEMLGATVINDIAPPPGSSVNNVGTPQPAAIGAAFAPFSTPGVVNSALFFGGGRVEVPPQNDLNFGGGSFSIDGWMRPVQCTGALPATVVDKFDTGSNTGFVLYAEQPTLGTAVLKLRLNGAVFTSSGTFALGTWAHVAVTLDISAGIGTFYINGSSAGTFTTSTGPFTNTVPMWIGRTRVTALICELGIDELEIFNRALTQAELQGIYSAGSAGKCVPRRRRAIHH